MNPSYRVVVHGILPGSDRDAVIAATARLVARTPDALRAQFAGRFILRICATPTAAARLEQVLTLVGCACSIEHVTPPIRTANDAPARQAHWQHHLECATRAALKRVVRLATRVLATGRAIARMRAGLTAFPDYGAAPRGLIQPQRIAAVFGVLATLGVVSATVPDRPSRPLARPIEVPGTLPLAPVAPDFFRPDAADPSPLLRPADASPAERSVRTPFGVVSLIPIPGVESNTWEVRWNGRTLREVQAETTPSLIPQSQGKRRSSGVAQFGREAVVVVDSGERSALCPASRVFLVVLSSGGHARTQDLPNRCVELESVAFNGVRILFRYYDQPRATLAFDNGRLVKLTD